MIQIIHISDFHLDSKPISIKKTDLINALIDDLNSQDINLSKCIIVISGDLIDKGGKDFASTKDAFKFFQEIFVDEFSKRLSIKKEQFFFVPGNHDIDRNKIESIVEKGTAEEVSTISGINDFILKNREKSKYLDRLKDYKEFEQDCYADLSIKKHMSNFDSCFLTNDNAEKYS